MTKERNLPGSGTVGQEYQAATLEGMRATRTTLRAAFPPGRPEVGAAPSQPASAGPLADRKG